MRKMHRQKTLKFLQSGLGHFLLAQDTFFSTSFFKSLQLVFFC